MLSHQNQIVDLIRPGKPEGTESAGADRAYTRRGRRAAFELTSLGVSWATRRSSVAFRNMKMAESSCFLRKVCPEKRTVSSNSSYATRARTSDRTATTYRFGPSGVEVGDRTRSLQSLPFRARWQQPRHLVLVLRAGAEKTVNDRRDRATTAVERTPAHWVRIRSDSISSTPTGREKTESDV